MATTLETAHKAPRPVPHPEPSSSSAWRSSASSPPAPRRDDGVGLVHQVQRPLARSPTPSPLKSYVGAGEQLFTESCASCHGAGGARHRPRPEPSGPRRRHRRLLGVHRPDAAGGLVPPAGPKAGAVLAKRDPADRLLRGVAGAALPGRLGHPERRPQDRQSGRGQLAFRLELCRVPHHHRCG